MFVIGGITWRITDLATKFILVYPDQGSNFMSTVLLQKPTLVCARDQFLFISDYLSR